MSDIWITGVGAATPLGCDAKTIGDRLLAGTSGVRRITHFRADDHPAQIAAMVDEIPCPALFDRREFAQASRLEQLFLRCCVTALDDAGWGPKREETRLGLVLGTATEWNWTWEREYFEEGRPTVFQEQVERPSVVQRVNSVLGLRGPALSLSAACASGNFAFMLARRWLELGWVDAVLTGAGDLGVTPLIMAGFGNLRALSRRNADPPAASRPFDKGRDGFVVGEGGVVFLLEKAEMARARGARGYARLAGCGAASDAFHMVIPSSDPEPAASAMQQAFRQARVNPEEVGYINAHATSTPVGDVAECRVLQRVFGAALPSIPVSSTKSMTGHLLTAAAAIEALTCIIALQRQALPPTINLHDPDPECPLLHVANQAQERRVDVAVSNSFGFGGSNTCAVFKRLVA